MQSPFSFEFDLKIKGTFRSRRKKLKLQEERDKAQEAFFMMAGEGDDQRRKLRGFITPVAQGFASSIAQPNIEAHNFEHKSALISMVQ